MTCISYIDGINLREARSPEAPKMTRIHGSFSGMAQAYLGICGISAVKTRVELGDYFPQP